MSVDYNCPIIAYNRPIIYNSALCLPCWWSCDGEEAEKDEKEREGGAVISVRDGSGCNANLRPAPQDWQSHQPHHHRHQHAITKTIVAICLSWRIGSLSFSWAHQLALIEDRVEICRDRHDRRSCKISANCVNFPIKQRNFSHNLRRTTRFTHTKCDFALKLLKFYTLS